MSLTGEQIFYIAVALIVGLMIMFWVLVEHLGVRVKARAKVEQTQAREETRREIAAYVAEGSISPDDAAKLLSVGAEGFEGVKAGLREVFGKGGDGRQRAKGMRVTIQRGEDGKREVVCERG